MTKKEEFEIENLHKKILSYVEGYCLGFESCKGCRDIAEALQKAVEQEREECASLAENFPQLSNGYVIETDIATAIRERQKGKL